MHGLLYRWRIAEPTEGAAAPGLEGLTAKVLAARGLTGGDAAAFLEPRLTELHDPSLMPGLDRACERLLDALRSRERVVIYGDYDVDGVSSTAILFHTMRALEPEAPIGWYIPHRLDEGYGLNREALHQIARDGARVVVSVDCGVTAVEQAGAAREAGLDLIITDHHNPPADGSLPEAYALVHPRLPGSRYPFGELAGAGVAFKLAWRLATMHAGSERVGETMRTHLIDMLAFAALGTVADIVPLEGENRAIAKFGLARLPSCPNPGVRALIEASGLDGDRIGAEKVGFVLGPRLNACGRMGHAREAVELLTTDDPAEAARIARGLTDLNDKRRAEERRIVDEAIAMAEAAGMSAPDRRAVVLAHESWHPGVIGIVCSRLVDRLHRPVILMQDQGEECVGSCRSIEGFPIADALHACREHLTGYGGHDMAAGVRLSRERLGAFVEAFTAHANGAIGESMLTPERRADCEASLGELTPVAVRQLEHLAPFGRRNPRPCVVLRGLRLATDAAPMGQRGTHLAMTAGDGGVALRFVGWGWGERRAALRAGATVDLLVEPKINEWRGRVTVEPTLIDARVHDAPAPVVRPDAGAAISR
jgi:single-stranded-DNA-specific exonuclease